MSDLFRLTAPGSSWTIGVVGHGQNAPRTPRERWTWRDGACAEYGHPGYTYNPWPWMNRTWCRCGEVIRDGDQVSMKFKHPASPLRDWWDHAARDEEIAQWVAAGVPIPDYDAWRVTP